MANVLQRCRARLGDYVHSGKLLKDVRFFVGFAIVYLVLQAAVVANVIVPTASMRDTIRQNERFLVWKLGFGMQNPLRPREKLRIGGSEILKWRLPERGQTVLFVPPERSGKNDQYVKRVIALPGETVEVRPLDGVYVDGRRLDEPYVREVPSYRLRRVTVPEGHLFLLGDNRNKSYDSHFWGFAPLESIQGVVALRYWPPWRAGLID